MPDPQQRWPDDMPLEAQLGNALGLALAFLKSGDWNNQDMARIETPFKAWCDQVVDGPAVPDGREPASVTGEPSDEELLELMPQQMRDDLAAAARALAGFDPDNIKAASVFRIILNRHVADHARAVLSRWGTPNSAEIRRSLGDAPQPVPVSERLPGPGDCDAEGRCWLHLPDMGTEPLWCLTDPALRSRYHSHWLPANALPQPSGEVE